MNFEDKRERNLEAYMAKEDEKFYAIVEDSVIGFVQARVFSLHAVEDRRVIRLIELLNSNSKIISLYIGYSGLTNWGIKMLAERLQYVKKLHLDAVNLGREENTVSTLDALTVLATSNVQELKILRTIMTNEEADVLIHSSKQVKLNIRDNRHVDEEHVRRADIKAEENSADESLYRIIQNSVKTYEPPRLFSLNSIEDRHIPKLIELLNTNSKVIGLYIGDSELTNWGIKMLAERLQYVTKLHLDSVNLGSVENNVSTFDALTVLATSNIRELKILRTIMTNEEADVLIQYSKQVKLNIRDNRHVDEEHVRRADKKAEENSTKELGFFGSPSKRTKKDSDDERNLQVITPPDKSPE